MTTLTTLTNEQAARLRRERTRRSDYPRTAWQRAVDFYALTPTVGTGFWFGLITAALGAWFLRPYPIYAASTAWSYFAVLVRLPEWALGAVMIASGGVTMWACYEPAAELHPYVKKAAIAAMAATWAFLFAAFVQLPQGPESPWIPVTAGFSLGSLWLLTRTGTHPRPRHPPAAPDAGPGTDDDAADATLGA